MGPNFFVISLVEVFYFHPQHPVFSLKLSDVILFSSFYTFSFVLRVLCQKLTLFVKMSFNTIRILDHITTFMQLMRILRVPNLFFVPTSALWWEVVAGCVHNPVFPFFGHLLHALQVEGPKSPEEMLMILQKVIEESNPALLQARLDAEERRNNMRLREEQDAAYRAALEADQVCWILSFIVSTCVRLGPDIACPCFPLFSLAKAYDFINNYRRVELLTPLMEVLRNP